MKLEHSPTDAAVVAAQLGRAPRGDWAVAARCHLGVAMVIESAPRLDDGTPFPTLFWLTCPILVRATSRLEAGGRMNALSSRLASDEGLRARLANALDRYRERRAELGEVVDAGGPPGGGPERVKCLHAHVAHELADGPNPVGALTLSETGWPDCRTRCVEVAR